MRKIKFLLVLTVLFLSGCSKYVVRYEYGIEQINRLDHSSLEMTYFGGHKAHYTDNILELFFDFDLDKISFQLENLSKDTLEINLNDIKVISDGSNISLVSNNLIQKSESPYKLLVDKNVKELEDQSLKIKIDSLFTVRIEPGKVYSDNLTLKYSDAQPIFIQSDVLTLVEIAKSNLNKEFVFEMPVNISNATRRLEFIISVKDYYLLHKG